MYSIYIDTYTYIHIHIYIYIYIFYLHTSSTATTTTTTHTTGGGVLYTPITISLLPQLLPPPPLPPPPPPAGDGGGEGGGGVASPGSYIYMISNVINVKCYKMIIISLITSKSILKFRRYSLLESGPIFFGCLVHITTPKTSRYVTIGITSYVV